MWSIFLGTVGIAAVLSSAAFHDIRTREVPDIHWTVGGLIAAAMSSASVMELGAHVSLAVFAGASFMLVYMLSDRLPGWVPITVSVVCYLYSAHAAGPGFLTVSLTSLALVGMYRTGMIRGGADVKALLVLAMAYPSYPEISDLPLLWHPFEPVSYVFGLSMSVLAESLLMVMLSVSCVAFRNFRGGYVGRGMFSTLSMDIDEAERSFVWPAEDIVCGKRIWVPSGSDDPGTYARLRSDGVSEVRVTPMIPFIVPMAVSFVSVVVLGSPFFWFAA